MICDIYAFHIDLGNERLNQTIPLWESIWRKHGWTPHILGMDDAKKHPEYNRLFEVAESMPTVNDRRFSTANFLRWCAFARVNGAVSDYDVLPRAPFPPRDFKMLFNGDNDGGPGFIVGECSDFERIVNIFLNYQPRQEDNHLGTPHVSDMVIQHYQKELYQSRENLLKCYGVEGWNSVPLTHFGNSYLDNAKSKRDQISEILKKEGAIYE